MFNYPWGDMHSLNLGWFLLQFKDWVEKIQEYLDNGGGTSENLANVIAPVFNAANSYLTGDYVLYNDELYKANEPVSPGTWDPSKWTRCLAMEEISSGAGIDNVARLMIAGNYSAYYGYQKYAICRYNDKLWMCNTNLPSGGEEWTPAHWDEITVGAGLTGLRRSAETFSDDIDFLKAAIKQNYPLAIIRIGRLLDAPYLTGNSNVLYGQAMCFYDNKYYVVGSYNSNANQSITVWSDTGILQNSAQFTTLGHCNGICATNDFLLIAAGNTNAIHIIDRSTLAYIRTISNISELDNVTGISNDNGTIYFFGYKTAGNGARTIYTLDLSNDSYTLVSTFPKPDGGSPQNFCVHNGYAYFLYVQGNNIFKFNLRTNVIEKIYDIPDGDGFNPCGECESLFYKDGNIYLHSELYYRDTYTRTYNVGISEIYKTDLLNPIQNTLEINYMKPETALEIIVNQQQDYTFNPYLKYSTIEEACHILNYLKYGMIVAQSSTAHGAIKLIGGIYSVRASGGAYVDEMHIINSFLEVSQISVLTTSYIRNSSYRGCAGGFGGTLEIWRTKFEITRFYMEAVTAVKLNRSTLSLTYITNAIPGTATYSSIESIANVVEIKDTYKQYCLRPLLATASGGNTNAIITIATPSFSGTVLLTANELVSGKTVTIGNDTIVFTNDFKITVNGNELSSTDIISATAIRRG